MEPEGLLRSSWKPSPDDVLSLIRPPHAFAGGRDSVVGVATRYELNGPGIKFHWGRDFSCASRPALGSTQPLYEGNRVIPRGKAVGKWCWPPTPI